MARPILWRKWKSDPLYSIIGNQESFEKYFLKRRSCIENTPKQRALFNLWIKKKYLEYNSKKDNNWVPYFRISKNGKEHKSHTWEKLAIANLNFFYAFAKRGRIHFDNYEKKFLSLSLLNHRNQILEKKGDDLYDKLRITLLDMVMIRLGRINRDLEKWLNADEKSIQDALNSIEDPKIRAILNSASIENSNLKVQSFGAGKLSEIIKDIEEGKNRYISQLGEVYQFLPEDMKESFYHLIYLMPLTLVIKILKLYLPFSIGEELVSKKVHEVWNIMRNPNNDQRQLSQEEVKIVKRMCNQYMAYVHKKSMVG